MKERIVCDDMKEVTKIIMGKCDMFTPYGELFASRKIDDGKEEIICTGSFYYVEDPAGSRFVSIKLTGEFINSFVEVEKYIVVPIFKSNGKSDKHICDLYDALMLLDGCTKVVIDFDEVYDKDRESNTINIDNSLYEEFNISDIYTNSLIQYIDKGYNTFYWKIKISNSTLYYDLCINIFNVDGYYILGFRGNDGDNIVGQLLTGSVLGISLESENVLSKFSVINNSILDWYEKMRKMYLSLSDSVLEGEVLCKKIRY